MPSTAMEPAAQRATLGRPERLRTAALISTIARTGKAVNVAPFRLVGLCMPMPDAGPARIAFAVPKRYLKRAHDRNRARRLMRDAYRRNKGPWLAAVQAAGTQCAWLLVYQAKATVELAETEDKISVAFARWTQQYLPQ